jgi:CubicO group peptidase (beta-lactamase class C family)
VQSNTNFRLASVTKQFTATAILLLEEKGLIDLNWTLDQVFEDFPEYGQNIQIHHLLNHTSGLLDYEDFVPDSALVNPVMDQGVLAIIQNTDQTYFPAGEQFRYSNTAFALLALMVEKYSGQDFPEFLEENIFKPLDMNATVAHIKNQNTVPKGLMAILKKMVNGSEKTKAAPQRFWEMEAFIPMSWTSSNGIKLFTTVLYCPSPP